MEGKDIKRQKYRCVQLTKYNNEKRKVCPHIFDLHVMSTTRQKEKANQVALLPSKSLDTPI